PISFRQRRRGRRHWAEIGRRFGYCKPIAGCPAAAQSTVGQADAIEEHAVSAGRRLPGTPDPDRFIEGAGCCRLAADVWGDPDGPLVLLQHGGGQTRHAWKGAGEILGRAGYHAVALDARGHGDSDWAPDGAYGQDVMV